MVKFEEPKVEFIALNKQQVVFSSPGQGGAGGTMTCVGDPVAEECNNRMAATT